MSPPAHNRSASDVRIGQPIVQIFNSRNLYEDAYVEPEQAAEIEMHLEIERQTLLVEGPSGVGKTTVVARAIKKLGRTDAVRWFHCGYEEERPEIDLALGDSLAGKIIVLDDFHLLDRARQERVTRLVKRLASPVLGRPSGGKLVLIGINPISSSILSYMHDARGCYATVRMGRQTDETIDHLIGRSSLLANVTFTDRHIFVQLAEGNFVIAQRLCREALRQQKITRVPQHREIVASPADQVVAGVQEELHAEFGALVNAFASFDVQAPPRGACLLLLWHLTRSENGSVPFSDVRYRDAALGPAFDWLLASNLAGFFQKNPGLPALLYYNRDAGVLSAEDPQLRFYLKHSDWKNLARATNHRVSRWDPEDGPVFLHDATPAEAAAPVVLLKATGSIPLSAATPRPVSGARSGPHSFVLHVSDLHFTDESQARIWQNQLASDLRIELRRSKLDALIVSGDIANTAEPAQYEAASRFLLEVASEFELAPHQIVLVPGNHDVSWEQSKRAYVPKRRADYKDPLLPGAFIDEGKYIEVRGEAEYLQRFAPFAAFYESVRQEPYPLAPAEQATLHHFPDQNLLILGLNSAWYIDHYFKERAGLNGTAVSRALSQIRNTPDYAPCTKLAVWHHPPAALRPDAGMDEHLLEQLAQAGFRIVLHGHIHAARDTEFRYYRNLAGGGLEVLAAGTFGAPTKELLPGYPFQYQLLEFGPGKLTVHTRRKEHEAGAWKPDARWLTAPGQDPLPRYTVELAPP